MAGAAAGGLDVIAIADHDTTAALAAAQAAAVGRSLQVIPALEVSSTWQGREVHVLGYFVSPEAPALTAHGRRAVTLRQERMREMVARLARAGIHVAYEDVEAAAGPQRVNLGRPHLAKVLVSNGHVSSVAEAFSRLIGDQHAAFVPTRLVDPAGAVSLILEGGGIPVWAHPPADLVDTLLPGLMRAGLRGLEVYRPTHSRSDVIRLEGICRSTGLVMSGGSDWHSPDSGVLLGAFHVTGDEVEKLLAAGGM
ncbi:MAG: PHP domain-containing protein [Gemmatimonadetes bacterium]|nr:PHP domain-containing protein [Gemmatimonadota bacterium]